LKPLDHPLLADENIHPEVVMDLRRQGRDVVTVVEGGLLGRPDPELIAFAARAGRVVVTHDRDFASLWWHQSQIGIVYLRPGHIPAAWVIEILAAIDAHDIELAPPFLVTAERRRDRVRIVVRSSPREAR
jgi:predicted nuclease of predicted toxin-antitoxin system